MCTCWAGIQLGPLGALEQRCQAAQEEPLQAAHLRVAAGAECVANRPQEGSILLSLLLAQASSSQRSSSTAGCDQPVQGTSHLQGGKNGWFVRAVIPQ